MKPFFLVLALLSPALVAAQADLSGRVVDAETGAGVAFAAVVDEGSGRGVAADAGGYFRLALGRDAEGTRTLRASALGYTSARAEARVGAHMTITLEPSPLAGDEVVVEARGAASDFTAPAHFGATEDLLARVPGVDLLQRGQFAWEPTVRGLQAGQIGVTIDGMRVYGACVDRMDPASSYVEPENLARVEVRRGALDLTAAPGVGGAVDFETAQPTFDAPPSLEAEVGGETGNWARRVRLAGGASRGRLAARASFSYRAADDFAPGDGGAVLPHSGYDKRNGAFSAAYRLGGNHRLTAALLADDAWLVGYPVLLMDATLASARVANVGWAHEDARGETEARVYRSRVDHWMDDRFRDVREREVMRGMYMPMAGWTDTWGLVGNGRRALGAATEIEGQLDIHRTGQFGDMEMLSVFPGIPDMYLLNVGEARATNAGAALALRRALGRVTLRADTRLDFSWRDVHREEARALLAPRVGQAGTARRLAAPSVSAVAEWDVWAGTRLRAGLAAAGRLPTLVESYGHYVYNYQDGFFYSGDPDLRPERSLQGEAGVEHAGRGYALRAAAFVNELGNAIAGIPDAGLGGSPSGTYEFRAYRNVGRMRLWGGEASGLLRLGARTEVAASASAVFGHRHDLHEPMAQIPPVRGLVVARHRFGRAWAEAESRWALAQNRVARAAAGEVATDGYNVLALRGGAALGRGLDVRLGVENVLDEFYREHTAVGRLPGRGRQLTLALRAAL